MTAKTPADTHEITLFNTLTKSKEKLTPLDPKNIGLYVCGPTVYDYAHIGNARPAIVFDVLFRVLRHAYGLNHITYVRNITDVEDKITIRAKAEHPKLPLNEAIAEVTKRTERQYISDMSALGCLEPSIQPRATEHITEMVEMCETLIANGNAYAADGHVLFSVKSFKTGDEIEYGKLARRSLDDMIAGARVEVATYKKDPMDFVLWKPSSDEEPGWDSPWGRGRPGWHIECSAMSAKYLGAEFDIHGGGIDLSFPHHENELAQSRCAHGTDKMASIWMHNGFLQVEGEKMSKSLGNFITVDELLSTDKFGGKKWPGDVLRLAVLMTNYREPIDFSVSRLEEAEKMLWTFWSNPEEMSGDDATIEDSVMQALADDLNMPKSIAAMHALHKSGHHKALGATLRALGFTDNPNSWVSAASLSDDVIAEHINARLTALAEKDWATADKIRAELLSQGIQLKDGKDPETGERITTWEVAR